jgi:hypothetical protein
MPYMTSALPDLVWVQIEPSAVEVDRCFEILDFAEATGHVLDLLDLAVEPLAHGVGHRMLVVGQDVVNVLVHWGHSHAVPPGARPVNISAHEGHGPR